ncbi:a1-alpha2 repression, partial [Coemansia sp. RSA 2337]
VVARRWCKDTEQLVDSVNKEDVERIRLGLRDLDSGLGAYPLDLMERWRALTCFITSDMLERILPAGGEFSSATGSVYEDEEMEAARRMLEQQAGTSVPTAEMAESLDRFSFPHIDVRHSVPPNADPSLVCRYGVDKSWLLQTTLAKYWNGDARSLVGEFQLAFLIILVGQNFAGLEHWKRLLHLALGCIEALEDGAFMFVSMLKTLNNQLNECPKEFGTSVLDQDNFLAQILTTFVLNLYESEIQDKRTLEDEVQRVRDTLAERFQWVLPSGSQIQDEAGVEEGEYAPQIVD